MKQNRLMQLEFELNENFSILIESIEKHFQEMTLQQQKSFVIEQISRLAQSVEIEYFDYENETFTTGIIQYFNPMLYDYIKTQKPKTLMFCIRKSDLKELLQTRLELIKYQLQEHQENPTASPQDVNFEQYDFGYIKNEVLVWTAENIQFAIVFHSITDRLNLNSFTGYSITKKLETFINNDKIKLSKEFNFATFKTYFESLNNDKNCYPVKIDLATAKETLVKLLTNQ